MEKEKVIEGNKLIAEFMGAKIIKPIGHTGRDIEFPEHIGGLYVHQKKDLKYHTSWDWLMPVVEKIQEYGKWKLEPGFACLELYRELGIGHSEIKREKFMTSQMNWETESGEPVEWIFMVHHIVVKFITWYNTQEQRGKQ